MKLIKGLKINALVSAILYLALGILFVALPEVVIQWIAIIAGVALVLAGIACIIDYFRKWDIEYRANGLAIGILLLFAALFLFLQSDLIVQAIPILLGFAVVVSGTIKLQNAIVLYKVRDNMWKWVMALAALCLVMGVIFMVNPFATTHVLVVLIGVGLIVSGVTDLVIIFLMSRRADELSRAGRSGGKRAPTTDQESSPN